MSADEQRKLAAIMFTDMVGYSALSQRNADASADRQIQVRIGVHIGDVVHRGGDVYGDGVNIASRIEPVAGPGGICVSMDVERQIRNALEERFEKLAPTELKNISVSMDLFRIVLPWERDTRLMADREKRDVRQRPSIPIGWIAAVLLLLLVLGAWFLVGRYKVPSKQSAVTELPAKSIAVLPFENLSRDPDNAFFTDGVQDQILTDLSQIADLKVISRTSVMQYKSGVARNLREIGQQ